MKQGTGRVLGGRSRGVEGHIWPMGWIERKDCFWGPVIPGRGVVFKVHAARAGQGPTAALQKGKTLAAPWFVLTGWPRKPGGRSCPRRREDGAPGWRAADSPPLVQAGTSTSAQGWPEGFTGLRQLLPNCC